MTKLQLAAIYQKKCSRDITLEEAKREIEEFLQVMEKALIEDGKIKFTNIGVLEVVDLKPRKISNPSTGKPMMIYPKKDVRFREAGSRKER